MSDINTSSKERTYRRDAMTGRRLYTVDDVRHEIHRVSNCVGTYLPTPEPERLTSELKAILRVFETFVKDNQLDPQVEPQAEETP